jgi:hypothetical protein
MAVTLYLLIAEFYLPRYVSRMSNYVPILHYIDEALGSKPQSNLTQSSIRFTRNSNRFVGNSFKCKFI